MFARVLRFLVKTTLIVGVVLGTIGFGPRVFSDIRYRGVIHTREAAPSAEVAIVFGAGLRRDGRASLVLRDRVDTAAALYFAERVDWLLFSGHSDGGAYDEPEAMRDYALTLGVPDDVIVLDKQGNRTYDTCRRAADVYSVSDALLVTQHYHLDRALLTCDTLGIEVQGVSADSFRYADYALRFWWLREIPATTVAIKDLFLSPPTDVVLGKPVPVPWAAQGPATGS